MNHDATLSGISSCNHKHYSLSCEEFETLLERADHSCEICKTPGVETGHKKLFIDHDPRRGLWAVRGLLCASCNSKLANESAFSPAAKAYLGLPIRERKIESRRRRQSNPRSEQTSLLDGLLTAMEEAEALALEARVAFSQAVRDAREHPEAPISQVDIARDLGVSREWLRVVQRKHEASPAA